MYLCNSRLANILKAIPFCLCKQNILRRVTSELKCVQICVIGGKKQNDSVTMNNLRMRLSSSSKVMEECLFLTLSMNQQQNHWRVL